MTADVAFFPEGADSLGDTKAATAPYMSFIGFRNLLDRFANDGLPQIFDRSFFGDLSGSTVAQIRGTLKFFGLIDDDRRPTEVLRTIAAADTEVLRVEVLRDLTQKKYSNVIALGVDATQGQLVDVFRATGLSGESVTKAITFYLGLADYTELPISPFFKKTATRPPAANGNAPRRSSIRKKKPLSAPSPHQSITQEAHSPNTLAEKKSAYIDLLMKFAEQSAEKGEIQSDLLDRLERALGYATSTSKEGD